ncbi:hypothetical protein V5799_004994 [Amblyomma americanum]|uniref:Uncharacterized protein n=1 Tax=Amblyomma americanum TaxID=6943 RepID=A0AAQ4D4I5_AMBAM
MTGSESGDPAPSTSRDIAVQYRPGHSSDFAAASAGAVPVQRDDGEVFPKQKRTVQVHLPSESMTGSESGDPAPSTSRDIAVQYRPGHSSVFAVASAGAVPVQRDDGEVFPKQKRTVQVHLPSESMTGSESGDPAPSTSRDIAVQHRPGYSSVFAAASAGAVPVQRDDGEVFPKQKRTVQVHLPSESMTGSESGDPASSTSRDIAVQYRPGHSSVVAAASAGAVPVQPDDGEVFPKQKRTVQVHLPSESMTGSESGDPAPSTSRDIAVQYRPGHSSVFAVASAGAVPVQRDDGEVFPKQKRTVQVHLPSESMTGSESGDPAPSTSRDIAVQHRPGYSSVFAAASAGAVPVQRDDGEVFPKQKRTVQVHLPSESMTGSESGDPASSTSRDIAVQYRPGHSSVVAAASAGAVPVQRDDGEVFPKQKRTVQVHLPSESMTGSESGDPAPSTSHDIAVQYRPGHSSVFAAASAGAVLVQRDDGEVFPKQKRTVEVHLPSESMTGSESGDPAPSTSHDFAVQYRPGHSFVFAAASAGAVPVQRDDGEVFPKQKRTVQVHLPLESMTGSESGDPAPSTSHDIAVQYRPGHSSVFAAARCRCGAGSTG